MKKLKIMIYCVLYLHQIKNVYLISVITRLFDKMFEIFIFSDQKLDRNDNIKKIYIINIYVYIFSHIKYTYHFLNNGL